MRIQALFETHDSLGSAVTFEVFQAEVPRPKSPRPKQGAFAKGRELFAYAICGWYGGSKKHTLR